MMLSPEPFEIEQLIEATVERCAAGGGPASAALLPVLHRLQLALGWIPATLIATIAERLNLSVAEVSGVVSFYHDFRAALPARPTVKICRAEACQALGGERLFGKALLQTRVAIEPIYCIGLCGSGPAALFGERVVGRLDDAGLERLLAEAAA